MRRRAVEPEEQSLQAIRSAAHEWRARVEAGEMGPAERRRFEAWLANDPRHRPAYDRAAQLWQEVGPIERAALPPESFRPLPRERLVAALGQPRRPLRQAGAALAAAALVLVVLEFDLLDHLDPNTLRFETAIAEVRDVTLPDGSLVTLGADSSLRVAMDETARRVTLRAGEAYFDVAKDARRPFTVEADDTQAEALGTAFELRRAGEGLQVAVAEGLVEVRLGAERSRLRAGQRVAAGGGQLGEVRAIDPGKLGAWRRGRLVYIGAPLSEVIADANRYHEGWIVLLDERTAALEITAVFDATDIEAMLTTLAEALPVVIWRPLDPLVTIRSRSDS